MTSAHHAQRGYIALLSVLILGTIAASTVLVLLSTSLSSTLNSGNLTSGKIAKSMAEACGEFGLQRLTNGSATPCSTCPVTTNLPQVGSCKLLSITNTSGTTWRIRTTGSGVTNNVTKYLEITAQRIASGSAATITSWREVTGF